VSPPRIFSLERAIDSLYDEVYPSVPLALQRDGFERAFKPILCDAMGCLVPEGSMRRRLAENRSYYRVDLDDFMEFATSELAPIPTLGRFPDGIAAFYEFTRGDGEGYLNGAFLGKTIRVWPIDALVVSSPPFVSVTVRSLLTTDNQCLATENAIDANIHFHQFVTLTFAAKNPKSVRGDSDSELEEWDRYGFSPPLKEDPQWRFHHIDGIYSENMRSTIAQDRSADANVKRTAEETKKLKDRDQPSTQVQFEIARLMLSLPAYVTFMYDLVSEERREVKFPQSVRRRLSKPKPMRMGTSYRIIKSIRIIRPEAHHAPLTQWRSPPRLHAVRGYWRSLSSSNSVGKAKDGSRIVGRTWVRDHTRGDQQEFLTESELKQSNVVINIKQTLQHARDVLQAASNTSSGALQIHPPEPLSVGKRSIEWMAEERAKLSAGLRFLILKRDAFRCQLCGLSAAENNSVRLEVDHK
jgi:hypothetical protein